MNVKFLKMVKTFTSLISLALLLTFVEVKGEDNCERLGVLLYEEIGCKPIKAKPKDLCPSSYDCNHLQESGDHCYFQGVKYKNREALPDNATSGTCNAGCFCYGGPAAPKFTCAAFDCAEFLGGNPLTSPECIRTYDFTSCCSSGQACPPFDKDATCQVDGVTYKHGQRFSPKGVCKDCICQKGFNGKYESPFCKRNNCVVELRHLGDIKDNCAPVYDDEDVRCCPHLWVCPAESDIFSPAKKNDASAKTCKFGAKEIKSGQTLERSLEQYGKKYNVKCDCQLPPLLTCIVVNSEYIKNN